MGVGGRNGGGGGMESFEKGNYLKYFHQRLGVGDYLRGQLSYCRAKSQILYPMKPYPIPHCLYKKICLKENCTPP